ncbi:hypothetical protein VTJ04DRAFT_7519 [Mycothermus thermophilus]|uniref:uncharacterized protein n=1 Tax=Humicola insolens TaxID=85995 RepID=UPI003743050C
MTGTPYKRHQWISWWSIDWRFTLALVFSLLLIAVLYGYSRSERLGTWDQRAFNTLTILFSSLASLSLGSLLGLLGAALRWPYSVFGLTYDLNDDVETEYPIMATDFGSVESFQYNSRRLRDFGLNGFSHVVDRRVDGNTVTYTYHLHEYKGPDGCLSSDEVIQSSSTCTGRVISLGIDYLENETRWIMPVNVFENGKRVATYIASSPTFNEINTVKPVSLDSPEFVHVLAAIFPFSAYRHIWAIKWNDTVVDGLFPDAVYPTCMTTYIYGRILDVFNRTGGEDNWATFHECKTCITGGHGDPGLPGDLFFNYDASLAPYLTSNLLMLGTSESFFWFYAQSKIATAGTVPVEQDINAAHLVARAPILALVVKWQRAIAILAGIMALELVSIALTWLLSHGVPILDHESLFALARLLSPLMPDTPGGSLASKTALAREVEQNSSNEIQHGTKRTDGNGVVAFAFHSKYTLVFSNSSRTDRRSYIPRSHRKYPVF